MILLIDNYDSFTYNLVHFLGDLGAEVEVVRNDQIKVEEIEAKAPEAIVLSPGPCTPNEAGICVELVEKLSGKIPILGVCLGHQSIAQAFGGKIVRAQTLMHGKISLIHHEGSGIFKGIENEFEATRYHSLVAEEASLPKDIKITARTEDGTIMGIAHKNKPVFGVQFHPESIASKHGHQLLKNFLDIAGAVT